MKPLLDFIAKYESRGDYDAIWGGIAKKDHPRTPLTRMTVGEVLDWQDSIDHKYRSEAAGRYQILEDTLRDIYSPAGVRLTDTFSEYTQDRLAIYLLKRRGLSAFLRGDMRAEDFANSLAREWASLPVVNGPKKGRSFYAGDGLNKAHAPVDSFLKLVNDLGPGESVPHYRPLPQDPMDTPTGPGARSFWQALADLFNLLFRRIR